MPALVRRGLLHVTVPSSRRRSNGERKVGTSSCWLAGRGQLRARVLWDAEQTLMKVTQDRHITSPVGPRSFSLPQVVAREQVFNSPPAQRRTAGDVETGVPSKDFTGRPSRRLAQRRSGESTPKGAGIGSAPKFSSRRRHVAAGASGARDPVAEGGPQGDRRARALHAVRAAKFFMRVLLGVGAGSQSKRGVRTPSCVTGEE